MSPEPDTAAGQNKTASGEEKITGGGEQKQQPGAETEQKKPNSRLWLWNKGKIVNVDKVVESLIAKAEQDGKKDKEEASRSDLIMGAGELDFDEGMVVIIKTLIQDTVVTKLGRNRKVVTEHSSIRDICCWPVGEIDENYNIASKRSTSAAVKHTLAVCCDHSLSAYVSCLAPGQV